MKNWDDLRLFLAVARLGGLSGAARATGLSPATVGRRMAGLESVLGAPLFHRSQSGYRLTEFGAELLEVSSGAETSMNVIARWLEAKDERRTVRISLGTWTTYLVSQHVRQLWAGDDPFDIELTTADEKVDIGHRAADIGIRTSRPTERWLAGRLIGKTAYATYGARTARDRFDDLPMAGASGAAVTPLARWLGSQRNRTRISASDAHAVREIAASGIGITVLPCFVGDTDDRLVRAGGIVPELTGEQWLVVHHDARHEPAIRTVVTRLVALMRRLAPLMTGKLAAADRP